MSQKRSERPESHQTHPSAQEITRAIPEEIIHPTGTEMMKRLQHLVYGIAGEEATED